MRKKKSLQQVNREKLAEIEVVMVQEYLHFITGPDAPPMNWKNYGKFKCILPTILKVEGNKFSRSSLREAIWNNPNKK